MAVQRKLVNQQAFNLGVVSTIVFGPIDCLRYDRLMVEIYNPSGTETINGVVDVGSVISRFSISPWAGLDGIAPGETRLESFDKTLKPFLQIRATATAAVTNALVTVYAQGEAP